MGRTEGKPIVVVYGPTACGKSALAVELALSEWGEIISADSRQIYKALDIGTGKIPKEEMREVPHFGLDLIEPDTAYSVAEFQEYARGKIDEIHARGKLPILCGGTGLYIDATIFDYGIARDSVDLKYRAKLEALRQKEGNEYLWQILFGLDPEYAKTIHPNSYPYVMRGLEMLKTTGKSKSAMKSEKKLLYDVRFVTPYDDADREFLYSRINERVEQMFRLGFQDEVKRLCKNGYTKKDPGLGSIGYREMIDYFDKKITLRDAKETMKQGNRNYAKRQITWFGRYGRLGLAK